MKKRIVLGVLVLLFLATGGFVLLSRQKPKISNTLSSRSQEYLKNRDETKDTSLRYVDLNKKENTANKTHTVGTCFRFKIPFRVGITRLEKECEGYYQILNPSGRVLAYVDKSPGAQDQMSGIGMRRKMTDLYSEETKLIGKREFIIFTRKDAIGYDKNVYYHTPEWYMVLNLSGNTGDNLDTKLIEMLASVEFL